MKQKLSFNELFQKLMEKNILTGTYSEKEVERYLSENCYYYKIASYRKNYPKSPEGVYKKLIFDHLDATARLDNQIREYLLHICLDVEHATRTKLMTKLTNSEKEDGYQIVKEFNLKYSEWYQRIIRQFQKNRYKAHKYKQSSSIPAWTFIEIIDYGALIHLLELFVERNPYSKKGLYVQQHKFIKNIRNTCAHNDIFLINIFNRNSCITQPNQQSISYANLTNINGSLVHYHKVNDLVNLFYIHSQIASNQINNIRHTEGLEILNSFHSEFHYFKDSNSLTKFFSSVLPPLIDILNKSS